MQVCDHCRKAEKVETLTIKGKHYDLCNNCLNRILNFLNTPEKKLGEKIGEIFK